jgi:hypothetical protein
MTRAQGRAPATYIRLSDADWDEVGREYMAGETAGVLGRRWRVSPSSIYRHAQLRGWTKRRDASAGARAHAEAAKAATLEVAAGGGAEPVAPEPSAMATRAMEAAAEALVAGRMAEADRLVRLAGRLGATADAERARARAQAEAEEEGRARLAAALGAPSPEAAMLRDLMDEQRAEALAAGRRGRAARLAGVAAALDAAGPAPAGMAAGPGALLEAALEQAARALASGRLEDARRLGALAESLSRTAARAQTALSAGAICAILFDETRERAMFGVSPDRPGTPSGR